MEVMTFLFDIVRWATNSTRRAVCSLCGETGHKDVTCTDNRDANRAEAIRPGWYMDGDCPFQGLSIAPVP